MLDTAHPEILDNYGEMVRSFHTLYGPAAWFLVYQADVRMRSEHFERLRRQAERAHGAGTMDGFNPAKPWASVFAMAISDKSKLWWDENVIDLVLYF